MRKIIDEYGGMSWGDGSSKGFRVISGSVTIKRTDGDGLNLLSEIVRARQEREYAAMIEYLDEIFGADDPAK